MNNQNDTIYALATPPGRSGVAIIRVSGPRAVESLERFLNPNKLKSIKPRFAFLANLFKPNSKKLIDKALIIYFKAPNSFTGEDVVEYQLHGSPAVISEISQELSQIGTYRPAERGEFTRRGFENDRMDLTEAEAIADLIDAETIIQKDLALDQMSGSLKDLYEDWSDKLKKYLAFLEADLDFPDEDLPDGVTSQVYPKITEIKDEIYHHLNDNRRGERVRDGLKVAIIGAPNAGKSSLLNVLARRDVAITSDFAGTTRDILEVHLDIEGYPITLIDTAGLKPELLDGGVKYAQDEIESEGIRRALKAAQNADIKILLFEADQIKDAATLSLKDNNSLMVTNKIDLKASENNDILISTKTEEGINDLLKALSQKAEDIIGNTAVPTLTRERHRFQLEECFNCLERALSANLPELAAEDTRLGLRALSRITGRVDVEDLLDVIFSEFCIGK